MAQVGKYMNKQDNVGVCQLNTHLLLVVVVEGHDCTKNFVRFKSWQAEIFVKSQKQEVMLFSDVCMLLYLPS